MRGSINVRLRAIARFSGLAFAVAALVVQPIVTVITPSAFATGSVGINEVSSASSPEWVELYGPSGTDLNGWTVQFDASNASQVVVLGSGDVMDANGFFVVETPTSWLNNTGDTVILFDETAAEVDTVGVPGLSVGQTYAASTDGGSVYAVTSMPSRGTTNQVPAIPSLQSPVNAAIPAPGAINFTWTAVAGATGYVFEYAEDAGFSSATSMAVASNSTSQVFTEGTWYWRVAAQNAVGQSAPTASYMFTVGVAPTEQPTIPTATGTVIFDSMPQPFPSNVPSLGYSATQTSALGDRITFAGTDRHLDTVQIDLSSWACETGSWNTACVTTPGTTFSHDITLNLYETDATGQVGSLIASKTQSFSIPYRPTSNPACGDTRQWMDTNGDCFSGIDHVIGFDMMGVVVPDSVVFSVAYSTEGSGPYDSLNVGLNDINASPAVGTDVDSDVLYWDTMYPGYTGGLIADTGWTPYMVAARFTAFTPDTTKPTVTLKTSSQGSVADNVFSKADFKLYDGVAVASYTVNGQTFSVSPNKYSDANGVSVGTRGGQYGLNTITATDTSGNVSDGLTFYLDNVAPTATVKSDSVGYQDVYTKINFKLYDEYKVSRYKVNDGAWKTITSNKWSDANNIQVGVNGGVEGVNTITVEDVAGNQGVTEFTLDNTAPQISVKTGSSYTVGSEADAIYSLVSFKLHDNDKVRRYYVNGTMYTVSPNPWSDANYIAVDSRSGVYGTNEIVLEDRAGNTTSYSFVLDNVAPTLAVKDVSVGSGTTFSSLSLKLYDEYMIDRVELNGVVKPLTHNKWSDLNNIVPGVFGAVEGENTLSLYDAAGNVHEYVFTLDTTAPLLTISEPQTVLYAPGPIVISGEANDDVDGQVMVTLDGQTQFVTPDASGNWFATFVALEQGTYTVYASASDVAGNETMDTRDIVVAQQESTPGIGAPVTVQNTTPTPQQQTTTNTGAVTTAAPADENGEVLADETGTPSGEVLATDTEASATDEDASTASFLGLAWYWWILIVLGLGSLWFVFGRRTS